MKKEKTWLAAYLYYAEPWEDLLREAVFPFAKQVLKKGLAEEYFYIRYWEQGPHIRLRFYGDKDTLEKELKPQIIAFFNSYFTQKPSERKEPVFDGPIPDGFEWLPNNSIQWIAYEPETDRYGGEKALRIGEQHFQDSSDAILSIIAEQPQWNYDRALGAAIQLHLGFAHAAGMDLHQAQEFYRFIFAGWLPMAYGVYKGQDETDEHREGKAIALQAFEENFERQKAILIPYQQQLWEAFEEDAEFEQDWLNDWVQAVKKMSKALKALAAKGQVIFPQEPGASSQLHTSLEDRRLWTIYASYVHMTNNRLGILNRDEGYLGYLIQRSTETILA